MFYILETFVSHPIPFLIALMLWPCCVPVYNALLIYSSDSFSFLETVCCILPSVVFDGKQYNICDVISQVTTLVISKL